MTMTWQNGRELASMTYGTRSMSYTYGADGLRTGKTVNSTVSKYEYAGGQLLYEQRGTKTVHYIYDSTGNVMAAVYKPSANEAEQTYYYTHNWRGDVLALYDSTGALYARYQYDAWGRLLSLKDANGNTITSWDDFAVVNPFRYRGYYYDNESGLYYLQSRYYDPVTGRFVNGDTLINDSSIVCGNNLFAYCNNNPIILLDPSGTKAIDITLKLLKTMYKNALYLCNIANVSKLFGGVGLATVLYKFYSLVKTKGKWDFKNQKEWKLKSGDYYVFMGKKISAADVGNIHFGYVASVLFSWKTMCTGAGIYQIYSGTSSWDYWYSFFDDPKDTVCISMGRVLWAINFRRFAYQM